MPLREPASSPTLAERYCRVRSEDPSTAALERFIEQLLDIELPQLLELLLVDQALESQRVPGPSVEQYLQRFPAVAGQREAVVELVYGEMRAARALGLPVDVEAYVARFPDLAEPLRRQMEVSAWLADDG